MDLKKAALAFSYRASAGALAFISQLIIVLHLSKEDVGLFALSITWIYFLSFVAPLGFNRACLRFIPQYDAHRDTFRIRSFVQHAAIVALSVSLAIALMASLIGLLFHLNGSRYELVAFSVAVSVPFAAGMILLDGIAWGFGAVNAAAATFALIRWALFGATFLGAWALGFVLKLELSLTLLTLSFFLAFIIQYAWVSAKHLKGFSIFAPKPDAASWWPVAVSQLGSGALGVLRECADVIALTVFVNVEAAAVYYVALRLVFPLSFVRSAVLAIAGPKLSQSHYAGTPEATARAVRSLTFGSLISAAIVLLSMALVGPIALPFLGEHYAEAYPLLLVLAAALLLEIACCPAHELLELSGHHSITLRCEALAFAIGISAILVLIPMFGLMGAAAGTLIGQMVVSGSVIVAARYRFKFWVFGLKRNCANLSAGRTPIKI